MAVRNLVWKGRSDLLAIWSRKLQSRLSFHNGNVLPPAKVASDSRSCAWTVHCASAKVQRKLLVHTAQTARLPEEKNIP